MDCGFEVDERAASAYATRSDNSVVLSSPTGSDEDFPSNDNLHRLFVLRNAQVHPRSSWVDVETNSQPAGVRGFCDWKPCGSTLSVPSIPTGMFF